MKNIELKAKQAHIESLSVYDYVNYIKGTILGYAQSGLLKLGWKDGNYIVAQKR